LKIPEEKIKVTHIANPLTIEVKDERIIKEDYILHVGGEGVHKNFHALLTAYSNSNYLRNNFKLVKFGVSRLNKIEEEIVGKNKIKDRVVLLSGSDIVLANLYKYASAFVFPSLYEGFGIPPLEAMHYGCPVVVSNRSSMPEIVGEAGLYFDPENQEEIIEKCETLLNDSDLRVKLITKGYLQEKKFSWEKCFNETLSAYLDWKCWKVLKPFFYSDYLTNNCQSISLITNPKLIFPFYGVDRRLQARRILFSMWLQP